MAKKRHEKTVIARRGLMLVLSSPSGAGKTTLSRRLLDVRRKRYTFDIGDDAQEAAERRCTVATTISSIVDSLMS